MGFFSWNCKACGHSILSKGATQENNTWMSRAVVLNKDGEICKGEYDGYGRLGSFDHSEDFEDPEIYHEACWNLIGKPTEFSGASDNADDQGWFFGDDVHNFHEPKTPEELHNVRLGGVLAQRSQRNESRAGHLEYLLEEVNEKVIGLINSDDPEVLRTCKDVVSMVERIRVKDLTRRGEAVGLSFDEFSELNDHMVKASPDSFGHGSNLKNAEKLEDGTFRLTNKDDVICDYDFNGGTVYMIDDPDKIVDIGTEANDWPKYMASSIINKF